MPLVFGREHYRHAGGGPLPVRRDGLANRLTRLERRLEELQVDLGYAEDDRRRESILRQREEARARQQTDRENARRRQEQERQRFQDERGIRLEQERRRRVAVHRAEGGGLEERGTRVLTEAIQRGWQEQERANRAEEPRAYRGDPAIGRRRTRGDARTVWDEDDPLRDGGRHTR